MGGEGAPPGGSVLPTAGAVARHRTIPAADGPTASLGAGSRHDGRGPRAEPEEARVHRAGGGPDVPGVAVCGLWATRPARGLGGRAGRPPVVDAVCAAVGCGLLVLVMAR